MGWLRNSTAEHLSQLHTYIVGAAREKVNAIDTVIDSAIVIGK